MAYSLISRLRKRANKQHRCVWCGMPVVAGSTYVREISTYDGHFQNHAWHEACDHGSAEHFAEQTEFDPLENEMPFFELYRVECEAIGVDA